MERHSLNLQFSSQKLQSWTLGSTNWNSSKRYGLIWQIIFRSDIKGTNSVTMPGTDVQISSTDDGAHWTAPTLVDLGMYFDMNPGPGTGMQFTDTSPWPGRIAFIGYFGANKVCKFIIRCLYHSKSLFFCPVGPLRVSDPGTTCSYY